MEVWLTATRAFAAINLALLVALGSVWLRNYRRHGATHTLGLLVLAAFLFVENALWIYFYTIHDDFVDWFVFSGTDVQVGITLLCGLEFVALVALARITWW